MVQYDVSGNLQWTRQVGSPLGITVAKGVSTDSNGNIYITGYTNSGISGHSQTGTTDYFIVKYNSLGDLIWSKQVGSDYGGVDGTGISADNSGVIYVTGYTDVGIFGQTQNGFEDYFIAKYDADGNLSCGEQLGAAGTTQGRGISADNSGNIYVAGLTNKGLSGQNQNGAQDYFIAKYDATGNLKWSSQAGALGGDIHNPGTTWGSGISTDGSGNTYITGQTDVGINGQPQNGEGYDYFIAKYTN